MEWNECGPLPRDCFRAGLPHYKKVAPESKIMLGSVANFDQNAILDSLGRARQFGIKRGRLLLDVTTVREPLEGPGGPAERVAGALAVRENIKAADLTVSVDAPNKGLSGSVLRYKDARNYVAALYAASDPSIMYRQLFDIGAGLHTMLPRYSGESIMFHEVVDGHWGPALALTNVQEMGPDVHFEVSLRGMRGTFTLSDGRRRVSASCKLQQVRDAGSAGLIQRMGNSPQLFGNFLVVDAQGKTLAKDAFDGKEGVVPPGWRYVSGGPNPVKPGLAPRIDGIEWHSCDEPDAEYFAAARQFQARCRELGFKGRFFAGEVYGGSMYPPGPPTPHRPGAPITVEIVGYDGVGMEAGSVYPPGPPGSSSETVMAKHVVRILVGHSGLGVEAGYAQPHFTAFAMQSALCQATWGMQTLNPCRPTMAYYMWRTVATVMDDFQPADFPVRFSNEKGLVYFTFQRGDNERMVAVWMDGLEKDGIVETKTDVTLPGVQAKEARVIDVLNGTEQKLVATTEGGSAVFRGMMIKDYPTLIRVRM